ncbi:MAG: DUF294 nucleotidyltransferase-like domain-containing protein, partial [Candidatus Methylomirabilales bacterium]
PRGVGAGKTGMAPYGISYGEVPRRPTPPIHSSLTFLGRPIREIMSHPVVTCPLTVTAREAARRMAERALSALVVIDERGGATGLVTERDLVARALAEGALERSVGELLSPLAATVGPDDVLDRALLLMVRHGVKHLVVTEGERPVGIVTVRDLLRSRSGGFLAVLQEIERANTPEALVEAFRDVEGVFFGLFAEGVEPERMGRLSAEFTDRLVFRAIAITLARLAGEGRGRPPVPFCWLMLGSAGRREQVARTDQDNALVYGDPPAGDAEEVQGFFLALGTGVVKILAQAGFAYCPGGVMASEPKWCLPLSAWEGRVRHWAGHPEPAEVRDATLFLDFRPVEGVEVLEETLRDWVIQAVQGSPQFVSALVSDDADVVPPLAWFGKMRLERSGEHRGCFNLKHLGMAPIAGIIRALALCEGIRAKGTLGRLRALVEAKVFSRDEAHYIEAAFRRLWGFRIRLHVAQIRAGEPIHNYIDPRSLARWERQELKVALREVVRLERRLHTLLGVMGGV